MENGNSEIEGIPKPFISNLSKIVSKIKKTNDEIEKAKIYQENIEQKKKQ